MPLIDTLLTMAMGVTWILQWRGFARGVQGQSPGKKSGDEISLKLMQNVKLVYTFNVFL